MESPAKQQHCMPAMEDPYLASPSVASSSSSSFATAASDQGDCESYAESINTSDGEFLEDQIMKGKIMSVQHIELEAPALPAKSALRKSQIIMLRTKDEIDASLARSNAVHAHYLSEEDASSEADDFSDFSFESESEVSESSSTFSRKSHESTARAISVIYSGKPIIVDVPVRPRSVPPVSVLSQHSKRLRRVPGDAQLVVDRRSLISSMTFPLRSASLVSNGEPLASPSFLNTDPFANTRASDAPSPKSSAGMFKRKFSLSRKTRHQANNAIRSPESLSISPRQWADVPEEDLDFDQVPREPLSPETPSTPVSYQDIMRLAKRNAKAQAQPTSPTTSHSRATSGSSMSLINAMSRRRSVRL